MPRSKKAAVPVTGDEFTIRVLPPVRKMGVGKAREASEIFKMHGARTRVETETRNMFVTLPKQETLVVINAELTDYGMQLVKTDKVVASYEWQFNPVKGKK